VPARHTINHKDFIEVETIATRSRAFLGNGIPKATFRHNHRQSSSKVIISHVTRHVQYDLPVSCRAYEGQIDRVLAHFQLHVDKWGAPLSLGVVSRA
jgi:hypothetical protein